MEGQFRMLSPPFPHNSYTTKKRLISNLNYLMLHTKSFNECQKPHGNNKINLIHFYPDLWMPIGGQRLYLTMSVQNYSQMGQVRGFAPIGLRPIGANPRRECWPIASVRIMSSGLRLGEVNAMLTVAKKFESSYIFGFPPSLE